MSRATDIPSTEPSSAARTASATIPAGKVVCPFCGSVNDRPAHDYDNTACPKCTMADTPATRQATRARLGPWFVRQNRNPAAPGMKFDTLMALVKRGQVTAQSVVRGPTTGQFWRFAAQVKGLSREFGVCYNCATAVEKSATICPQCNRLQEPPANPDVLLENAPTASAPAAPVHREIKTPAPAPVPAAVAPSPASPAMHKSMFEPAPSTAGAAAAAAVAPNRSASPSRRAESESRDLLAPPAAAARPRPKPKRGEEGILSARDLATAFQLDFKPPTDERPRSIKSIVLVVLLLAVSAGAAVLILNPHYRESAHIWLSEKSSALRDVVTGRTDTPVKVSATPPVDVSPGKPAAGVPATQPSGFVNVPPEHSTPRPTQQAIVAKAAPETRPAVPTPQITIAPVPTTTTKPESTTAKAQPAKDTPVAKVAAAPIDAATASSQAIALWRQALDAEARRDYAKAVEHYEQIKKLPKSAWPAGLEINLALAKKRVK